MTIKVILKIVLRCYDIENIIIIYELILNCVFFIIYDFFYKYFLCDKLLFNEKHEEA